MAFVLFTVAPAQGQHGMGGMSAQRFEDYQKAWSAALTFHEQNFTNPGEPAETSDVVLFGLRDPEVHSDWDRVLLVQEAQFRHILRHELPGADLNAPLAPWFYTFVIEDESNEELIFVREAASETAALEAFKNVLAGLRSQAGAHVVELAVGYAAILHGKIIGYVSEIS